MSNYVVKVRGMAKYARERKKPHFILLHREIHLIRYVIAYITGHYYKTTDFGIN